MKEVDTKDAFNYWLDEAKSGDECLYYEGFLLRDKELALRGGGVATMPTRIVCAQAAWGALESDRVILYQRKNEDLHYEYYAKKR